MQKFEKWKNQIFSDAIGEEFFSSFLARRGLFLDVAGCWLETN